MKKLLYYSASWCHPCKMMGPIVDELKKEGYNITKVDIDKEQKLVDKYGVMSIPTFIVVEDDVEVDRLIGVQSKDKLKSYSSLTQ